MRKKLFVSISLVALLVFSIAIFSPSKAFSEVYNWGNTDLMLLLKRAFNATSGHNHDGTNSRRIRAVQTLTTTTNGTYTLVPTAAMTFLALTSTGSANINATTIPTAGDDTYIRVLTQDNASYGLNFNTGFKSTGSLTTGTTAAKKFMIHFVSDGTNWVEEGRTTAQ